MFWFVTYKKTAEEEIVLRFYTVEEVWKWLETYKGEHTHYPQNLTVYKAESVFDGS